MSRVTHLGTINRRLAQLNTSVARVDTARSQLSTGRKFDRASQDPRNAILAMDAQATVTRYQALADTTRLAQSEFDAADTALASMTEILHQVEQTMRNAVAMRPPVANVYQAYAADLQEARTGLIAVANTSHLGRPLFSGTADGAHAFDPTTGAYQGNDGKVRRTVLPGVQLQTNMPGSELFQGADARDLITLIDDVIARLGSADPAEWDQILTTDLPALSAYKQQVNSKHAELGMRDARLQTVKTQLDADRLTLDIKLSNHLDVELEEVVVALPSAEMSYQAALVSISRAQDLSLARYMR